MSAPGGSPMTDAATQAVPAVPLLSAQAYQRIDREVAKYPAAQKQSAVMAALAIAQDETGWVTPEVIDDLARYLGMAPIAVYEVASFYNMYNNQPVGKFKIGICTCLPCALRDGAKAGRIPEGTAWRRLRRNHQRRTSSHWWRTNAWAPAVMRPSAWSTTSGWRASWTTAVSTR